MADGMFGFGVHFTKSKRFAISNKNRVIPKTGIATFGPDNPSPNFALNRFTMTIGPTER
jgi:hypothetical protein